jgi:glucose/arabinose dehydrogenase
MDRPPDQEPRTTMPTRKTNTAEASLRPRHAARRPTAKSEAPAAPPAPRIAIEPPAEPALQATASSTPKGKLGLLVQLMRRPEGATVVAMSEATGWLPHSVRGALAGSLKKGRGYAIASEPAEGGRVYRIAAEPAQ